MKFLRLKIDFDFIGGIKSTHFPTLNSWAKYIEGFRDEMVIITMS